MPKKSKGDRQMASAKKFEDNLGITNYLALINYRYTLYMQLPSKG